jgi:hypothetical protein
MDNKLKKRPRAIFLIRSFSRLSFLNFISSQKTFIDEAAASLLARLERSGDRVPAPTRNVRRRAGSANCRRPA